MNSYLSESLFVFEGELSRESRGHVTSEDQLHESSPSKANEDSEREPVNLLFQQLNCLWKIGHNIC